MPQPSLFEDTISFIDIAFSKLDTKKFQKINIGGIIAPSIPGAIIIAVVVLIANRKCYAEKNKKPFAKISGIRDFYKFFIWLALAIVMEVLGYFVSNLVGISNNNSLSGVVEEGLIASLLIFGGLMIISQIPPKNPSKN